MSYFSDRLLEAILNSGLSYGDISKLTGIPKSAISRYASGETDKCPIGRVKQFASVLGTTAEHLLGWETDEEPSENEEMLRRPGMRILFDAAKGCPEEALQRAADMLELFKNGMRIMPISQRLSYERKKKKLSQQRLSELSGVSQQEISKIETGNCSPNGTTVSLLARALGCMVSDLVDDEKSNPTSNDDESRLLMLFRSLNENGRQFVLSTAGMCASNPEYQKDARGQSAI